MEYTKTPSGLSYNISSEGTGEKPKPGSQVKVHYTGKLENGNVFDSSHKRNQPIEFQLGVGQVIKGWDEGISLLNRGAKATLVIPPDLGYGNRAVGGNLIPANSTLIFEVELVDFK